MPLGPPDLQRMNRCEEVECKARALCEVPNGLLPARRYTPESCDYFYPVADLRGENLRNNPTGRETFDTARFKTKRIRRRRDW